MRIQDLFKTTSDLVLRQFKQRMETLEENEKAIKEEQDEMNQGKKDGPNDGDNDDIDVDEDEDSEEEY